MRRSIVGRVGGLWCTLALTWASSSNCPAEERPLRETIDAQVQAAWQREGITPAPIASDAEFLRRVWLDLTGVIPTYEDTVAFLADASADKRAALIDTLLADPRYAEHQADVWDLLLFSRNPPGSESNQREGFQKWLKKQFQENAPYDEIVRQILRAEGNSVDDGPPQYLVQYRNRP
ncbi:MAG: DUF1549 domain-containing protein, partial [Pirellulales bacterium]